MTDVQHYDAETIDVTPAPAGAPVDPPDRKVTFATVVSRTDAVKPIVPAALRSKDQRRMLATWAAGFGLHRAVYHTSRSPKYALRIAVWAPWGAVRTIGGVLRWAMAEEGNWALRQAAANKGDADAWLKLDTARRRSASWRWWVVGLGALALTVTVLVLLAVAPQWTRWAALTGGVTVLARLGRPADRPIVDRVTIGEKFIKLTAEMTRAAIVATGKVKDAASVKFPREITRDDHGRGYLAVVDLPPGVIATDIIDKRDHLAAGFRLPADQVWPATIKGEHPGRLEIYVSDRPVSSMRQPAWPLLDEGGTDYFAPFPYGYDIRLRPMSWRLDERNSLFGGVPGSGKSLAARNVLLGAALDPLVIPAISELKGSGDYDMFEPLCPKGLYVSGADEGSVRATLRIVEWIHQLCEERGPLIAGYARQGYNSVKKLNRVMAERDERLRPVVALFDEVQEFMSSPYGIKGPGAGMLLSAIKRGRALGIHVIVATQRFDKDSLPKAISSLVTNRACLAVPAQPETDMVLGTSAYRTGARPTSFVPGEDSGWMVRAGFSPNHETVRAAYVDDKAAAAVCARALAARQGSPDIAPARIQVRNLLADVRAVWVEGEEAIWSELIVPRLVELDPEAYGDLTVDIFGARMRAAGVATVKVHRKLDGQGYTRAGVKLDTLEAGIKARQITGG